MGSDPALFVELFDDPIYQKTILNTFVFLVFGVNLKLFFALLLSGFFMRKGWWVKGLLMLLCCRGRCRRCRPSSRSTGC